MHGKANIRKGRGYANSEHGARTPAPKHKAPNFTGTGLRVDRMGCGMDDSPESYDGKSEYASDLSGRVNR
jgi:hypothetical protein